MPQEDEQAVVRVVSRSRHRAPPRCPHRSPQRDGDIDAGMRFVDHTRPYLATSDKPLDVEGPVRRCRRAGLIALGYPRQRCPDWNGAHRVREVGATSDAPAHTPTPTPSPCGAGDGRSFDAEHLAQLLVVRFRAIQRGGESLHATVLDPQSRDFALESGYTGRVAEDRSCEREEQDDGHGDGARAPLPPFDCPAWEPVLFGFKIAVGVDDDRDAAATLLSLRHPSNGAPRINSRSRARSSFE